MRVLVLGGSGFIGSHIVDKFLRERHDVVVFDGRPEQFRSLPGAVGFVAGDFADSGKLEKLIATRFDAVIHCIGTTTPKTSNQSPGWDVQSNVVGTLRLLDICVKHEVAKFIFLSSGGTVYGNVGAADKVDEAHPVRPLCSYGVTKVAIENYLHVYQHLKGLPYVTLRLSNAYGERQNPCGEVGALTIFLYRTWKAQSIEIWGDGSITRDFIYAGDIANAAYLATVRPIQGTYNVGTGKGVSLLDILAYVTRAIGRAPKVTWREGRSFDVPRIVLDASRFQRAANWQCAMPLHEGVSLTADWLRQMEI